MTQYLITFKGSNTYSPAVWLSRCFLYDSGSRLTLSNMIGSGFSNTQLDDESTWQSPLFPAQALFAASSDPDGLMLADQYQYNHEAFDYGFADEITLSKPSGDVDNYDPDDFDGWAFDGCCNGGFRVNQTDIIDGQTSTAVSANYGGGGSNTYYISRTFTFSKWVEMKATTRVSQAAAHSGYIQVDGQTIATWSGEQPTYVDTYSYLAPGTHVITFAARTDFSPSANGQCIYVRALSFTEFEEFQTWDVPDTHAYEPNFEGSYLWFGSAPYTGDVKVSSAQPMLVEGTDGSLVVTQARPVAVEGADGSLLVTQARPLLLEGHDPNIDSLYVSMAQPITVEGFPEVTTFVSMFQVLVVEAPYYERRLQNPVEVQVDYNTPLLPHYKPYNDPKPRLYPAAVISITVNLDDDKTVNDEFTLSILAARIPDGSLTYQWEMKTQVTDWVELTDGGVYSGTTTDILSVSDPSGLNATQWRCVVSDQLNVATPKISNVLLLTVT